VAKGGNAVRRLMIAAPFRMRPSQRTMEKHVILFLAANPAETDRLALDQECAAIYQELRLSSAGRTDFEFVSRWAVSVDELMRHLLELEPTVLHFSGHGGGSAGLVLQGEHEEPQMVSAQALAALVKCAGGKVRVAVLNACHSIDQAEALRREVDCVIGMTGAIGDDAARSFAVAFYRALGYRRSVGTAFDQAVAVLLAKGQEHDIPQCLTREGMDANQVMLAVRDGQSHNFDACADKHKEQVEILSTEAPSAAAHVMAPSAAGHIVVPSVATCIVTAPDSGPVYMSPTERRRFLRALLAFAVVMTAFLVIAFIAKLIDESRLQTMEISLRKQSEAANPSTTVQAPVPAPFAPSKSRSESCLNNGAVELQIESGPATVIGAYSDARVFYMRCLEDDCRLSIKRGVHTERVIAIRNGEVQRRSYRLFGQELLVERGVVEIRYCKNPDRSTPIQREPFDDYFRNRLEEGVPFR